MRALPEDPPLRSRSRNSIPAPPLALPSRPTIPSPPHAESANRTAAARAMARGRWAINWTPFHQQARTGWDTSMERQASSLPVGGMGLLQLDTSARRDPSRTGQGPGTQKYLRERGQYQQSRPDAPAHLQTRGNFHTPPAQETGSAPPPTASDTPLFRRNDWHSSNERATLYLGGSWLLFTRRSQRTLPQ